MKRRIRLLLLVAVLLLTGCQAKPGAAPPPANPAADGLPAAVAAWVQALDRSSIAAAIAVREGEDTYLLVKSRTAPAYTFGDVVRETAGPYQLTVHLNRNGGGDLLTIVQRVPGFQCDPFGLDFDTQGVVGLDSVHPIIDTNGIGPATFQKDTGIMLLSPADGSLLTGPLTLKGYASTFEGAFMVQLRDSAGNLLAEKPVQAAAGMWSWGSFVVQIPFTPPADGRVTIAAYEVSAKDGSLVREVSIQVRTK